MGACAAKLPAANWAVSAAVAQVDTGAAAAPHFAVGFTAFNAAACAHLSATFPSVAEPDIGRWVEFLSGAAVSTGAAPRGGLVLEEDTRSVLFLSGGGAPAPDTGADPAPSFRFKLPYEDCRPAFGDAARDLKALLGAGSRGRAAPAD